VGVPENTPFESRAMPGGSAPLTDHV